MERCQRCNGSMINYPAYGLNPPDSRCLMCGTSTVTVLRTATRGIRGAHHNRGLQRYRREDLEQMTLPDIAAKYEITSSWASVVRKRLTGKMERPKDQRSSSTIATSI